MFKDAILVVFVFVTFGMTASGSFHSDKSIGKIDSIRNVYIITNKKITNILK